MQKSPFEKRLKEVEALVQRCLILLEGRNNMSEISNAEANHQKQLEQIHAELKSVKGLIVNKYAFETQLISSVFIYNTICLV